MGFASRGITSANVLAAIVDDATRFSGADIATIEAKYRQSLALFDWIAVPDANWKARTGTWADASDGGRYPGNSLGNDGSKAQNDNVSIGVFYLTESLDCTAQLLYQRGTDCGIAHIMLNDVDKGQIDMYGAGSANELDSVGIGTLAAGLYVVTIKIATKNGSATAYNAILSAFSIAKT